MAVIIFSGCAANQKSSSESSKTTKTVCNENSKTPSSATEDDDPRWIDANFFNSKIANITYYSGEVEYVKWDCNRSLPKEKGEYRAYRWYLEKV